MDSLLFHEPLPSIPKQGCYISMPEVDILADQIGMETDVATRIELANQADRIIWENVHTLPLYQHPELIATRSDLANYGAFGLSSTRWENVGFTD